MTPLHIEQRDGRETLICACCSLPFAELRDRRVNVVLVIQSNHKGVSHTNALTAEDLRRLLERMEGEDG
jgi:hypothetical protein